MVTNEIVKLATPRRSIPEELPEVSRLSAMVLALLGELTVTRERVDTLERLLEAANVVRQSDIEAYTPAEAAAAQRDQLRRRQIAKVMRPFRLDAEKAVAKMQHKVADADQVLNEEVMK